MYIWYWRVKFKRFQYILLISAKPAKKAPIKKEESSSEESSSDEEEVKPAPVKKGIKAIAFSKVLLTFVAYKDSDGQIT